MADREIEINGGVVVYEFVGPKEGEIVVLTPGGRFGKDAGGLHELAYALAEGGKRVLLWDRPNCGKSDVQLYGRSESHMRAETLGLMLRALDLKQVLVAGGSGGARDSIIFAMMWPQLVRRLAVWSIVGGTFSTMSLAQVYVLDELRTVRAKGIEGILKMSGAAGGWADAIAVNPRNTDRLLALGSARFERVMNRWLDAFVPKPNEPIPGVSDWEFDQIKVPALIIRGGEKDYDHPKRTSLEVHSLIEGSRLVEPPWPENAWERALVAASEGTGDLFGPWVLAAPLLLEFFDEA
ncbi:alpha/beta fold hydrolase [Frankia sp. AgB32]|uniref:alpha/beta fold hydrolase n=1 Tax=Frankia sp. AgB32 TaxID=631119 RepID=UPI002010365D|nr:alpha/beta hydrolase [Frankia sp. AgB32]MCK9896636.1 alpha/beta hydrolase [Frankia sp. AgB32]